MNSASADVQRARTIKTCAGRFFRFEQGSSMHVGLLGMVGRPSAPEDEVPFVSGTSTGGMSECTLELRHIHGETDEQAPPVSVWFSEHRTVVDLSPAFAGAPAEVLVGSGIPVAVIDGPVEVNREADAGDGGVALLTQMCGGKLILDPAAFLALLGSDRLTSFEAHAGPEYLPLRAFNAVMPVAEFLAAVGLTSTTLINQIAVLGFDLRSELGADVVQQFEDHLSSASAQLAWFIDQDDLVHTAQVVLTLTDFFTELFKSDEIVEKLAREERSSTDEIRAFIEQATEAGGVVYVNATWQTFDFSDDVDEIQWPEAIDISESVATQARLLRERTPGAADAATAAPAGGPCVVGRDEPR